MENNIKTLRPETDQPMTPLQTEVLGLLIEKTINQTEPLLEETPLVNTTPLDPEVTRDLRDFESEHEFESGQITLGDARGRNVSARGVLALSISAGGHEEQELDVFSRGGVSQFVNSSTDFGSARELTFTRIEHTNVQDYMPRTQRALLGEIEEEQLQGAVADSKQGSAMERLNNEEAKAATTPTVGDYKEAVIILAKIRNNARELDLNKSDLPIAA